MLNRTPIAHAELWQRTNFQGRQVSLVGGPAVVIGTALALSKLPAGRLRRAALAAGCGAGVFGTIDDLFGDRRVRGLRGHVAAARAGQLTTGNVKIVGIGLAGLIGAFVAAEKRGARVPAGLTVALAANAANLFDLRPGRLAKVVVLVGSPLLAADGPGAPLAAVAVGATLGVISPDLGEQTMLGDAGANTLGALLGLAAVAGASRRRILGYLAGLATLTVASEAVSFSAVIDRTPALRYLDQLGRRHDEPGA
jgi:UDP-GlcNAc:undecaprenyl-phosphate GlcNAc-1-phosphate transferase